MIDGVKMSASLGNVVYPHDWLTVASPQLLTFFYNKRLMKTRSFSWKDLPNLYDEFDEAAKVYQGEKTLENDKEQSHIKRLYELSNKTEILPAVPITFSHASMLAQIFESHEGIMSSLKKTGQYDQKLDDAIMDRIEKARYWVTNYAPESERFTVQEKSLAVLSEQQKQALKLAVDALRAKSWDQKELFEKFYEFSKSVGLEPKDFFKAGYLVILNKERGPKLAPFVLALGERAIMLFEQASY